MWNTLKKQKDNYELSIMNYKLKEEKLKNCRGAIHHTNVGANSIRLFLFKFCFLNIILTSIFVIKIFAVEDLNLILKDITNINKIPAHTGIKEIKYIKGKETYLSKSEIYFLNITKFKFVTIYPEKFKGNTMAADGKNMLMFLVSHRLKTSSPLKDYDSNSANGQMQTIKGRDNLFLEIDFNDFKKNYTCEILGEERLLNYNTVVIGITSLRIPQTFRKLWVESNKHFIIKEERYYDKKLYYTFFYSAINFTAPTAEQLKAIPPKNAFSLPMMADNNNTQYTDDLNKAKKMFPTAPFLKTIPPNFHFEKAFSQKGMGVKTIAVRYTDGMISLVINKRQKGFLDKLGIFGARLRELLKDARDYSPFTYYEFDKGENNIVIHSEFSLNYIKELAKNLQ